MKHSGKSFDKVADFSTQFSLNYNEELLVDLFAGGGGASTGLEAGLNRPVDIAINHNPRAISMHEENHPHAHHYISDVWTVDPIEATHGRAVGWMHASPDCTHHSQAAGGQPRKKEIRDLSWVVCRWAGKIKQLRIISLENVKQILNWGPLIAKRDKATGRVIKLVTEINKGKEKVIHVVAAPGEQVPRGEQYLIPDPKRKGRTWRQFVRQLESMGYHVEWRIIKACDFGAPTSRERLFMLARKDGQPIVWPNPTHAEHPNKRQENYHTADEIIDWSIACPSIFGRKKDLAEATLKRIAKGMKKYVIDAAQPFIVPIANWSNMQVQPTDEPLRTVTAFPKGGSFAMVNAAIIPVTHQGGDRVHPMDEPLRTVTGANRGELAITSATMIQAGHGDGKPGGVQRWGQGCKDVRETIGTVTASGGHAIASASLIQMGYGESEGQQPRALDLMKPLGVVTAGGIKHAVATAYMAQMNGGFNTVPGHDLRTPTTTITNTGSQQQLVTANLIHLNNNCDARDVEAPVETIAAGGNHHALVAAYLSRQFGASIGQGLDSPAPVVTSGGGGKSAVVELTLSKDQEDGALRVAAFLMQYYSEGGQWGSLNDPINTITTKDRVALVTVTIQGTPYVIVDIGLRMLQPRELYRAQGFPESYVIEHGKDGRPFTKSEQVFMCGNSVSPPPMAAIAMCNNPWQEISETVAA